MDLITAKTFDNIVDAHLLKSKLESEGIKVYLFDEHTISINILYNGAVGGIKLKIHASDIEKTKIVLNEIENTVYNVENGSNLTCPKCESHNINPNYKSTKSTKPITVVFISFLALTFPFFFKSTNKCNNCNLEFKNEISTL